MSYQVEDVNESSQCSAIEFLSKHEDYALFLLNNLFTHGFALSPAPNSGQFKIIRDEGQIIAVFCLTRRGNLLIVSDVQNELLCDAVWNCCREQSIPIKGLLGEWGLCWQLWQFFITQRPVSHKAIMKEILYRCDLSQLPKNPNKAKLLGIESFPFWYILRRDYEKEQQLPSDLSESDLYLEFVQKSYQKIIWGVYEGRELVSIADLNAKADQIAQVGGVYTIPSKRGLGYGREVVQQLMWDAKELHQLRKLVIFTRETNIPARRLYESLGAVSVGHYALIFLN